MRGSTPTRMHLSLVLEFAKHMRFTLPSVLATETATDSSSRVSSNCRMLTEGCAM